MIELVLDLEPSALLHAWRKDTGRLFLDTPRAPRQRGKAAIRIRLVGSKVAATVVGTVVSAHQQQQLHRLELQPEEASLPALRMLLAAAEGTAVPYQQRPLRYLARVPVVVATDQGEVLMTTFSVSPGGCGIAWSGPPPTIGRAVRLRVGPQARPADLWGTIRWIGARGPSSTTGVRLLAGDTVLAPWTDLLAQLELSGAPRS
ncbi:MAG: PilZ domain-containing protein [Anaeromyxobacter sp.]|nr:PilZ domain-containing protein [Anaeromyxobacter sp.]MBL0276708.1 PilZ domain-containing protein [Anaeromyxobacter sp.]